MKAKDLEERLLDTKKIYEQIEIPAELNERMRLALGEMSKATEDKEEKSEVTQTRRDEKRVSHMKRRWNWKKTTGLVAACAVFCFTAGLNISPTFATDMQANPVLGGISRVLTFRSYEISDGDKTISTEIPQVDGAEEGYSKDVNEQIQKIVADYEAKAAEDIEAYKEAFLATGGTEEEFEAKNIKVNVDYEVKCETEDTLSLVLTGYEDWNASTVVTEYYNINLKDNSEITLEDLLGPDYINIANESIKAQIAADSSGLYFDEEMGGFTTITPETNFYINEAGNPVIVFQKYEIAAGAAGMPEFEITK